MTSTGVGDWITIIAAAAGAVWGSWLIQPKHHPGIIELWNDKWSKETKQEQQ